MDKLKIWHEHLANNPLDLHAFHISLTKLFVEDGKYLDPPAFHHKILDLYDSTDPTDRFLCIDAPVGFAKSSTLKSYFLRNLLDCPKSPHKAKFQLYVSSTSSKVERQFSTFVRFCSSKAAQILYNFETVKANTEVIAVRVHGEERRIYAISANSSISGINFENHRPDMIGIDDIEEIEQAKSIDRTEALKTWVKQTLISRFPSLTEGRLRMIGTTLTTGAMITQIKRKNGLSLIGLIIHFPHWMRIIAQYGKREKALKLKYCSKKKRLIL